MSIFYTYENGYRILNPCDKLINGSDDRKLREKVGVRWPKSILLIILYDEATERDFHLVFCLLLQDM